MRRTLLPLLILSPFALAACGPSVPDSGAGVGFGDYGSYDAQREAALNSGAPMVAAGAQPIAPGGVAAGQPIGGAPAAGFSTERLGAAIDRASGTAPLGVEPAGVIGGGIGEPMATVAAPAPMAPSMPVAAPLPVRSGSKAPNVVQFALSTSHPVGSPMYQRSSIQLKNPERACAGYASADLAQIAFLEAGGPQKDRKGLDPDGDGYACGWDPTAFRAAVQ